MISLIQEAAQAAQRLSDDPVGMTTRGWIFMGIAWTTIISVAVFCYRKVLQKAFEQRRQRELLESPPLTQEVNHEKVAK
jgi:hypothetical protein